MSKHRQTISLRCEEATAGLAARLSQSARIGDCFLLSGEIGAGKSTFARAFIRARLGNPAEEVPSPTFTLVQTYADAQGDIWHCDLYRLGDPSECIELGLDEALASAICLIEWPEKLGDLTPPDSIHLFFEAHEDRHDITIAFPPATQARLEPALA